MKRFFVILGFVLLASGIVLGYRASATPWTPAAPFDVLGILWLFDNLSKLGLWVLGWILGVLGLVCLWQALRLPSVRLDVDSEQRRLLAHMIIRSEGGGPATGARRLRRRSKLRRRQQE